MRASPLHTTRLATMTTSSTLSRLIEAAGDLVLTDPGAQEAQPTGLSYDSRKVEPGHLFFCVPGTVTDGHDYARAAVDAGAVALCVERATGAGVPEVVVSDVRRAMARMSAAFFGNPSDRLLLLGVTGTNGKTTTAFLLESILAADGRTTGLIGTVETRVAGRRKQGVRTTPESLDLHALFAEMVDAGVDAVAMEVTSHALVMHRVEGLRFAAAAFTNLTQDHLDFHQGMEDYFEAKRSLFTTDKAERAAVNVDDPYGIELARALSIPSLSYGVSPDAQVRAVDISFEASQTSFTMRTPKGEIAVRTRLAGAFNVYNCLAAAATALQAGIGLEAIERGLDDLPAVPGRFESVDSGQPFSVVVDYAHTPDSLDNVLRAAGSLRDSTAADANPGRVLCVFGCGGDRDRAKRPLMGAVVARLADVCVVTSDNPRSEEPSAIVDQILEGVLAESPDGPDHVDVDRRRAIEWTLRRAGAGDVVVIAGKGHETGQEFATQTLPFDDREVAREVLSELGWEPRR